MHLVLPDLDAPARVILGDDGPICDDDFFEFCMANRDLRIERNAEGEIVIVPPGGGESDYRSTEIIAQLRNWAKQNGQGRTFGATACFLLPDGAALSPDAAWVSKDKLAKLPKSVRRKFMPIVPDFIVEVMSPSDRLKSAQAKMEQWISNGTALAWLIDGDNRTVYVYQAGQPSLRVTDIDEIVAVSGPVAGVAADLTDIWAGL